MTTTSRLVATLRPTESSAETARLGTSTADATPSPATTSIGNEPRYVPVEADNPFVPVEPPRVMQLIELILKDRQRLNWLIRDPEISFELLPRFLAIALAGFSLFGVAVSLVIASFHVWPQLMAASRVLDEGGSLIVFRELPGQTLALARPWFDGSAFRLIAAYDIGLIAAAGICLPSLYFYGLLSGVRMTMLDVTIHTVKGMSTTAVALVGILPIYVALSLGVAVISAPAPIVRDTLWLGMSLPFVAGLWGVRSLYVGFVGLADTMPVERRQHRSLFLSRLILSWAACYTAVTPVMIFTLWEYLAR